MTESVIFVRLKAHNSCKWWIVEKWDFFALWYLTSFEFMITDCKWFISFIKDSCDGSGLSTSESSKGSHPFIKVLFR